MEARTRSKVELATGTQPSIAYPDMRAHLEMAANRETCAPTEETQKRLTTAIINPSCTNLDETRMARQTKSPSACWIDTDVKHHLDYRIVAYIT